MECENTMSRSLPPEDVRVGQFVTILHVLRESEPFDCDSDAVWRGVRLQRTLWLPYVGGMPMKVVEVCLPFVLVERATGRHRTLDVRRHKLARVSDRYAEETFSRIRQDLEKKKKNDADDDDDSDDDDDEYEWR